MLVRYIAPPSPSDRTEQIKVSKSGFLVLGGSAVDISSEQYRSIVQNGYRLEVIDDASQEPESIVVDESSGTESEQVAQEPEGATPEPDSNSMTQSFGASPLSPYGADQEEG